MLPSYPQNTSVQAQIAYPVSGAGAITPTAVSAVLNDELGNQVANLGAQTIVNGATQLTITIPATDNGLAAGKVMGLRRVLATFTTADGSTFLAEYPYVIQADQVLVPMTNSFSTYDEALLKRFERASLNGWDAANEPSQVAALMTAYDRLCRLQYQFPNPNLMGPWDQSTSPFDGTPTPVPWQGYLYHHLPEFKRVVIRRIRQATPNDMALWPQQLQDALKLAQLIEADDILGGNPVEDKRRMGIVAEEAGDSKMDFQSKPLRTHVCREAMNVLTPFIYNNVTLKRR